jgi:hypothetical protein
VHDRQGAGEVGEEDDRSLQGGDENRLAPLVVGGDVGAELADPGSEILGGQVDVPDPGVG